MSHPLADTMVIPARFCGPPHSSNGGYVAGALAHEVDLSSSSTCPEEGESPAVAVSLRQPPPLDASMRIVREDETTTLLFGGAVIATARPVASDLMSVPGVELGVAESVTDSFPGFAAHPFPTCYVCGTERPDGLRIFPGKVDEIGGAIRVAAPWTPPDAERANFHEYGDTTPRTCLATTWAALDCIGGWAGDFGERLMVLGQMTAVIDDLPEVGVPHVVVGLGLGHQGRKTFSAATLYDADGRIVGRAQHTWISVDPEAFNQRVR